MSAVFAFWGVGTISLVSMPLWFAAGAEGETLFRLALAGLLLIGMAVIVLGGLVAWNVIRDRSQ